MAPAFVSVPTSRRALNHITGGKPFAQERSVIAPRQIDQHRINDRIRAREIRLIGPDGDQLGIKPVPDALRMARGLDLDLVEVAPQANPPVCRIMDYGKFRYEEAQKAKESRKKQTNVTVKEVKFRPKIGRGDFDTKVRKLNEFIHDGHKVKVTLQFRGREMAHPELGTKILDSVLDVVGDIVKVESQARLEGRNMSMVLSPDRKAIDAIEKAKHEAEEAAATATDQPNEVPAPSEPADVQPNDEPAPSELADVQPNDEPAPSEPADTQPTGDSSQEPAAEQHPAEDEPAR